MLNITVKRVVHLVSFLISGANSFGTTSTTTASSAYTSQQVLSHSLDFIILCLIVTYLKIGSFSQI